MCLFVCFTNDDDVKNKTGSLSRSRLNRFTVAQSPSMSGALPAWEADSSGQLCFLVYLAWWNALSDAGREAFLMEKSLNNWPITLVHPDGSPRPGTTPLDWQSEYENWLNDGLIQALFVNAEGKGPRSSGRTEPFRPDTHPDLASIAIARLESSLPDQIPQLPPWLQAITTFIAAAGLQPGQESSQPVALGIMRTSDLVITKLQSVIALLATDNGRKHLTTESIEELSPVKLQAGVAFTFLYSFGLERVAISRDTAGLRLSIPISDASIKDGGTLYGSPATLDAIERLAAACGLTLETPADGTASITLQLPRELT